MFLKTVIFYRYFYFGLAGKMFIAVTKVLYVSKLSQQKCFPTPCFSFLIFFFVPVYRVHECT